MWPSSDVRKNEKDPDVDKQDEENVEEEFAYHLFAEVQSTVDDDQHKLRQKHRQKWHWNLHTHTHTRTRTDTHRDTDCDIECDAWKK